jgi:hypothetical protein
MGFSNINNDYVYDDHELRMRARSRDEYEYLKAMKRREMEMYAMQNITQPPIVMPSPPPKPAHLNTKLLLTRGA